MKDLTIVVPIYKEDPEIVTELHRQLSDTGAKIIMVEDGWTLNLPFTKKYTPQKGYGAALKYGISLADTDYVLTMDGDGQHRVQDAIALYEIFKILKDGGINTQMLIGSRYNVNESFLRRMGRKCLNFVASILASHYMVDLNSGMRIFNRKLAIGYSPILCDTFSFTTSITMSMLTDKYHVSWVPINVLQREKGTSHVKVVRDGFITLWYIIKIGFALRTRRLRGWIRCLRGQ